jgi:hypothetical protein
MEVEVLVEHDVQAKCTNFKMKWTCGTKLKETPKRQGCLENRIQQKVYGKKK